MLLAVFSFCNRGPATLTRVLYCINVYATYVYRHHYNMVSCVCSQLCTAVEEGLVNQKTALQFLGQRFRAKAEVPDWTPDEITKQLLK